MDEARFMTRCAMGIAVAAVVGVLIVPDRSWGDSLTTVAGKSYSDVYIDKSESMYYVRDPSDGSVTNVRLDDVKPGSYVVSPRKTRALFLSEWKSKQPVGRSFNNLEPALSNASKRAPESDQPEDDDGGFRIPANPGVRKHGIQSYEQTNGILHLTNRPDRFRERSKGKTVYMDPNGVGVLTNLHDRFRNDDQYVAVHIAFEAIEVPERFMKAGAEFVSSAIHEIVQYYAKKHRLDANLVYAVIRQESNFNSNAVSRVGASGLMQLMPGTAAEMGVDDIFDPAQNIAGGTQYLAKMLQMFKNDTTLALAGYNAGPGNVLKYNGVPPFRETQDYVNRVKSFQRQYARGGAPQVRVAAAKHGPGGLAALPPENSEYIQFVLVNGAVTPAERIEEEETYYSFEFKHTTGVVQKRFIKEVIYPAQAGE